MVDDTNGRGIPGTPGYTRRRYLGAAGGAVAAGLAGCTGDDGGNGNGNGDDGNGGDGNGGDGNGGDGNGGNGGNGDNGLIDGPSLTRIHSDTLPSEMNWSPYAQTGFGRLAQWMCDTPADLLANGSLELYAIDDWSYDKENRVLSETLRDDLTFWNGDQYTAEDRYVYEEFARLLDPEASEFESVEQVDDLTVEWTFKDPQNQQILRGTHVQAHFIQRRKDIWRPYMEMLQDVDTQDERDSIYEEELNNHEIGIDEVMEKGLGTGSYELVDYDEQALYFEPYEGHRWYDNLEISEYREWIAGGAAAEQRISNQEVDFATVLLESDYQGTLPDHYQNIAEYTSMFNYQLLINQRNNEALQSPYVRRAMACALNSENIVTNFGTGNPIEIHGGMDRSSLDGWLDGQHEDYFDYGVQEDYESADYWLEMGGYVREDGSIYDDETGEEMSTINVLNFADYFFTVPLETAAIQLEEYGFPVSRNQLPSDDVLDIYQNDMTEWDITMQSHYAGGTQHPISFFDYSTTFGNRLGPAGTAPEAGLDSTIEQWLEEGEERSPYNGKELTPEIPTEVGAEDLSGETEELNLYEIVNQVYQSADPERDREQIKKLSWMWNFHMPNIDVLQRVSGAWANTQDYDWPADDPRLETNNGVYPLIKKGEVSYSDQHK